MLYFSELKNKEAVTEDGIPIGKLEDIVFLAHTTPKVTKLVVRDKMNNRLLIPISFLIKITSKLRVKKDYLVEELQENELYILRNLLDKQIIDLSGNKVVRVNDVAIQEHDGFYIAGVDVGILGLARWFHLDEVLEHMFHLVGRYPVSDFVSWADIQPLELARGQVRLKKEEDKLSRLRPEDLADYLEQTNVTSIRTILRTLDEKFAAEVMGNLNINYQTALFRTFKPEYAAKVLGIISPDEAVDILLTLSTRRRDQIIELMHAKNKKYIQHLLSIPRTSIGKLVSTDYITISPDMIARDIIQTIQQETVDFTFFNYVYVVSKENVLIGVFNLHELLLQKPDTPVYKFMVQNVVVLHLTTPESIAIKRMLKYKLEALPVIDLQKHMVGIVTFDDMTERLIKSLL